MRIKKKIIILFVSTIACLTVIFFIKDWASPSSQSSPWIKFAISCLCAAAAWMTGRDGISKKDTILTGIIFAFIVTADIFLVLLSPAEGNKFDDIYFFTGLWVFALVHVLHIIRYAQDLLPRSAGVKKLPPCMKSTGPFFCKTCWSKSSCRLLLKFLFFITVIISAIKFSIQPGVTVFKTGTRSAALFSLESLTVGAMAVYFFIISAALFFSWRLLERGSFPKTNARMIALGMTLFYCSDLFLALSLLTGHLAPYSALSEVSGSLVWILYSPAIMILSLSAYKWPPKKAPVRKVYFMPTKLPRRSRQTTAKAS